MQIELLQKYVKQPLLVNQLQLSMTNTGMIDAGLNVNMQIDATINRDGSILDYCRLKGITIQAWSPLLYGFFEGVFLGNDKFPELNQKINEMAEKYNVSPIAISIAWILRHPANIQVIVGSTNVHRLRDIAQAGSIELTRPDWYALYQSAGNKLP
jgi:predicted oxidoreductase